MKRQREKVKRLWSGFAKEILKVEVNSMISLFKTSWQLAKGIREVETEEELKLVVRDLISEFIAEGLNRTAKAYNKLDELGSYIFDQKEEKSEKMEQLLKAIPKDKMPQA
jgi:hypothetical protein